MGWAQSAKLAVKNSLAPPAPICYADLGHDLVPRVDLGPLTDPFHARAWV